MEAGCSVPDQRSWALFLLPTPGDRDGKDRQARGTLLPWRWKTGFWKVGGCRYMVTAQVNLPAVMVFITTTLHRGKSSCGEEWRRTENFYTAFRYCEVLGAANVERNPLLSCSKPSYTKLCYSIKPKPSCCRLLTSQQTHKKKKTLFTYYTRTCRNVCMYVCQSGRLGCETCAQRPAKIPWMLRGRGDIHFYFYGIVLPFSACLLSVIFLCFFTIWIQFHGAVVCSVCKNTYGWRY